MVKKYQWEILEKNTLNQNKNIFIENNLLVSENYELKNWNFILDTKVEGLTKNVNLLKEKLLSLQKNYDVKIWNHELQNEKLFRELESKNLSLLNKVDLEIFL